MGQGLLLGGLGCFLWGVVSVLFSPCHLASIPLLVSYVAGQNQVVEGRKAALYAVVFTFGLFITIATIGIICALLGRMLGDVGPYMSIALAGSSTALVKRFLSNSAWNRSSSVFRKLAGVCIGVLGLYFVSLPIMNSI